MNIGIPKERRPFEYRVGLSPAGIQMLTGGGHFCFIEHDAGIGAGFSDQDYEVAGARIVYSPHEVFGRADLLLKVARPLTEEIEWLRPGVTLAGLLFFSKSVSAGDARHAHRRHHRDGPRTRGDGTFVDDWYGRFHR